METNKTTTELALEWWNTLTDEKKDYYIYLHNKIEEIWRKETQELLYENQNLSEEAVYTPKLNQKECKYCSSTINSCNDIEAETCQNRKQEYDYSKLPMNSNPNIPNWMNGKPNQKQLPVICLNCKEIYNNKPEQCNCGSKFFQNTHPSNAKQFKQFDESLFKAYINKFSDEDKVKALEIIYDELNGKFNSNGKLFIKGYLTFIKQ